MGIAIIPAPSSVVTDNWVQLGTNTPTGGTTSVSFTGINSNYRKLWVLTNSTVSSSSATLKIRVNSISAAGAYVWWGPTSQTSAAMRYDQQDGITSLYTATTNHQYSVIFTNKNTSTPFATFEGYGSGGGNAQAFDFGFINSLTTGITTVEVSTSNNFTSNTGAITLYGTF
jgi:hypothetical protein